MGRPKGSKNKMGRPLIDFDIKKFETMCATFCTEIDIANEFECSVSTVNEWCKRNYFDEKGKPMTFQEVYKVKSSKGKNSLRSQLFKKCTQGNPAVLIFMAKNHLGMSDRVEQSIEADGQLSEFASYVKELKK